MADYLSYLDQMADKYHIPKDQLRAIYGLETGSGSNVRTSSAGAQGHMQLMPGTARDMGVANINDPYQNIQGGAKYYAQQLQRFGTPELAAAAYNSGPGRVARVGGVPHIAETQNYVKNFMSRLAPVANPVTAAAPSATVPPTQGPTAVDETDNTDLSGISDFGGAGVDFTKLNPSNMGAMFNKLQSQQRFDQGIQNAYAKQQQDAAQALIEKKQYGPSRAEQLFRLAAAIGKPMIRPSFGGVMANVMPELADMSAASQKATQDRQDAIAALHQRAVEAAAERYGTSQKSLMDLVRSYGTMSKTTPAEFTSTPLGTVFNKNTSFPAPQGPHIKALVENANNPALLKEFDYKFGPGAAARVLQMYKVAQ